jgi:hypothetical protein
MPSATSETPGTLSSAGKINAARLASGKSAASGSDTNTVRWTSKPAASPKARMTALTNSPAAIITMMVEHT